MNAHIEGHRGWRCCRRWMAVAALSLALPAVASAPVAVREAQQLVQVVSQDWAADTGRLQAFQRQRGRWEPVGEAFDVSLGRAGSGWGEGLHPPQPQGPQKREGDGRSPAGIFAIGDAFGYAQQAETGLPYRPLEASSYCIDVPGSPLYNRIVDAEQVGAQAVQGSTEPMRLDLHNRGDIRYREGFVILHNAQARPGQGSCIFAHLRRDPGEATSGCTSMEPDRMRALLRWLRPQARPLFVLLPVAEYRRHRRAWGLPRLQRLARPRDAG